jgi:hypothetical protein
MSADNWEVCPKCLAAAKDTADAKHAEVYAQYGKVSPEEFDRLRSELKAVDPEDFRSFREDYEFYGANEGELQVSYSGGCQECGLKVGLKTSKKFWPLGT